MKNYLGTRAPKRAYTGRYRPALPAKQNKAIFIFNMIQQTEMEIPR